MTGRHKAQEGSSGCNGPQGAFAAESINLQGAQRRLHEVLQKTKSEGTVKFLGVLMGPTEGRSQASFPRDLLEQIIGSHDYRQTKALGWWL